MKLYERFHLGSKIQRKIIEPKNFTYRNLIGVLNHYIKKGGRVLDIGCGVGTLSFYLVSKDMNVLGLDLSREAIRLARESAKNLGISKMASFYVSGFSSNKVKGKFDLIIMSEVLEHMSNDIEAIEYVAQILKNNGIVLISVPLKSAPLYRLGLLHNFDKLVGHLRRYSVNDVHSLLRKNGLKIVYTGEFEGAFRNLFFVTPWLGHLIKFFRGFTSDIISFLDKISLSIFGGSQVIIVAKK